MGARYALAWSSGSPDSVAACFAPDGSLKVNGAPASVGRAAIRETARGFMDAFPDMVVRMDSIRQVGGRATFYWTWTGTNTGPGGTGKAVHITGYEEWTLNRDRLIARSLGHFDEAEYRRQVEGRAVASE